jgi:hypothetical protein
LIDITPSLAPDKDDPAEVEAIRKKRLGKHAYRTWRDRDGEELWKGPDGHPTPARLVDYDDTEARLTRVDGQDVTIAWGDLNQGDVYFIRGHKWKDRKGEVVAEGRLHDFRKGNVYIKADDGSIREVPFRVLSEDDSCMVTAWWGLPAECTLGDDQYVDRCWTPITFTWTASAACHKPLYFEDEQLERYGHSAGPLIQPVLSGAHFFGSVLILPYQMGMYPPNECQYELGYYRAGNCAPWLLQAFPLSARGALWQAGVATGLPFIIP